jgi:hypothetical protein
MKIKLEDLHWASEQNIITKEQATALWNGLSHRDSEQPSFKLTHLIYYFGGLIVIGSMSWFMVVGWESWGGGGITLISLVYAACFLLAGRTLWQKPSLRIPGGILFTAAVWMTPLICYGLQRMLGWWPQDDPGTYREYHEYVRGGWIFMEISTIAAGCLLLRFVRFPFITFPIAFALWYLSMDLTPILFGKSQFRADEEEIVSIFFGAAMMIGAYFVDRRTKEDFAFWCYLFGLAAFWGGLSLLNSDSEVGKLIYCGINLALIFLSVFLSRKSFAIFGSLGVFGYLGHLSYTVFKDSLLFPFALSFLGILLILFGVKLQANSARLEGMVRSLPPSIRRLRPVER